MDRKKALSLLLVLWIGLVVGVGIVRLVQLGHAAGNNGPQALAADGQGGFFLATRDEILHVDRNMHLRDRHTAHSLGMQEINALLIDGANTLWIFDSGLHQLDRCHFPAWQCIAVGSDKLGIDNNVSLALTPERQLLISDNSHQRVTVLDENGSVLEKGARKWHYPNQITMTTEGLLLADTDKFLITVLDPKSLNSTATALRTQHRPYRFVRRAREWWVIEAGISLKDAELRHYRSGIAEKINLPASDPVAIVDDGENLILASQSDWGLLSIDPATGNAVPAGGDALQNEFTQQRLAAQSARHERRNLPYIMMALMIPALLGGVILQRRRDIGIDSKSTDDRNAKSKNPTSSVRINTDHHSLAAARAVQNRQLLKMGLVLVPLLLLLAGLMWLVGNGGAGAMAASGLVVFVLLLIPLMIYLGRRRQDRRYNQHFICGPKKLVHVVNDKPVKAITYEDIWLGDESLVLAGKRTALYLRNGRQKLPLWSVSDVQREISARIPDSQCFSSDFELGKALLRRGKLVGLSILAARFALVITIGLLFLLKLWNVVSHFWGWKIIDVFHRF